MPLFMDLHKASDYDSKPTVDDIKRNHIADLAVQHKYEVKFFQYWINEDAGLVFCLMEAPDKESCAAVHREAHGGMPCNVIELKGGDYKTYMGDEGRVNEFDIAEEENGRLDTGYRLIMVVDEISISDYPKDKMDSFINFSKGRIVNIPGSRKTIFFSNAARAIQCANDLIEQFSNSSNEIRIGLSAGEPVTDKNEFFVDAIQSANRLCDIAQAGNIVISPLAKQLAGDSMVQQLKNKDSIKFLSSEAEQFTIHLIEELIKSIGEPGFSIEVLCTKLAMSRSGLYRKITEFTGRSANAFINDLRMQHAFRLLRNRSGNVTQVSMEVGYNNPSYFARNFQKRFGILPNKARQIE